MNWAPVARIIIRYGVGAVIGMDQAGVIAGDTDLVSVLALALGAGTEIFYAMAVKKGWAK